MSSRSKKSSPLVAKTAGQSTTIRYTSTSPASGRPASPTLISRVDEKNQLASLNDRLAVYIEKVRSLELDNDRLIRKVRSYEESSSSESDKIKILYENELADARRLLDHLGKEKATVQLELKKIQSNWAEFELKLHQKEKALGDAEKRILTLESQINSLQARLADSNGLKNQLESELAGLKKELDQTNRQLALAKKQLEDETIKRVDLENRIQSIKEQLAFQQEVHKQEMESRSHQVKTVDIDIMEVQHQRELESQFSDALRQMREENDEQISNSRAEIETVFQKKFNELQNSSGMWQGQAQKSITELNQIKSKIDTLNAEIERLNNQANASASRVEYLERLLQQERDDHSSSLAAKDSEIRRLKQQIEEQLAEYRDLFDLKIQLDTEIAAYRKLLDIEETRMNTTTSPMKTVGISLTTSSAGSTGGRKRRLLDSGIDQSGSTSFIDMTRSSKAGLDIYEVDVDGKFIKLTNSSDKDISLAGWTLTQSDHENKHEVSYKFLRNFIVKPNQIITVWSQEKSGAHGLTDIIMKNQNWIKGDLKKTTVLNNYGEEVIKNESKRSSYQSSSFTVSPSDGLSRLGSLTRRGASSFFTNLFL